MTKNKSIIFFVLLVGLGLVLSGCATSAVRTGGARAAVVLSQDNKIGQVSIALSDGAREKLKNNLKFDQEKLRQHVERALQGFGVYDEARRSEIGRLEILVTSMRTRSNFSAVMWGPMAGADNIEGEIVVKDKDGNVIDQLKVTASYALGGLAGGQDDARMNWLYETFAKETLKLLTGAQK